LSGEVRTKVVWIKRGRREKKERENLKEKVNARTDGFGNRNKRQAFGFAVLHSE
jgi:hypothetical protein